MKIINIPPYRGAGYEYDPDKGPWIHELIANLKKRGQLEGVQIDIDEGYHTDHKLETRDEEIWAYATAGFLKRVRAVCEMGKYDAIVTHAPIDIGVFAARTIANIPYAPALQSAVHVASLLGDRFSIVTRGDQYGPRQRHLVQNYGLNHKLIGIRVIGRTSTYLMRLMRQYKKEERNTVPEVKKVIDDTIAQCIAAIEEDRVDTLIIGFPALELIEDEVRQGLDQAGYAEIQLVCMFSAAVEMAKAMVNMKLIQASRAYPNDSLKAIPKSR